MSNSRNSRREFLRKMACVACGGGAAALVPQLRMMGTAMAATPMLSGYKALVCIYLAGGNDSWNLVVPYDSNGSTGRYDVYSLARNGVYNSGSNSTGLALARPASGNAQIITDLNDGSSATNQYFLHPNLTNLAKFYNAKQLAFAVNVGTLTTPIDMNDYKAPGTLIPPQLFSHADQTNLWHQGNTDAHSSLGWGGLCADDLQQQGANLTTSPQLSLCVSVAGANRFEIGNVVNNPYQLSSSGLTNLSGMCNPCSGGASNNSVRDSALNHLLADTYESDFAGEYSSIFKNGRDLFTMLKPNLGQGAYAITTTFPNTSLGNQLKIVAQMIKLSRAQTYASRQIFFVQLGGFDLHSGLMSSQDASNPPGNTNDHAGLLYQLDQAVNAFWTEMGAQGAQSNVTAFTMTEFARTLQSNGAGSDHAWGGIHFALGGAVSGGKLYTKGNGLNGKGIDGAFPGFNYYNNTLPSFNSNAFSRGQLIPGISVDQYAATFAKWMDVTPGNLGTIFPNLGNFPGGTLGFLPTS